MSYRSFFFQCLLKGFEHNVCHRDVCNQLTVSQLFFSQYTMLLILLKAHITSATAETYYL